MSKIRRRNGGRRTAEQVGFQEYADQLANNNTPPFLVSGILTLSGNQNNIAHALQHFDPMTVSQTAPPQPGLQPDIQPQLNLQAGEQSLGSPIVMMQPINHVSNPIVNQLNITVVGSKAKQSSKLCICLTILLAVLTCIPIFCTFCTWWKKIVAALYEITPEFYLTLGRFLQRNKQCSNLTLTVIDNGFDKNKANILHETLQTSQLKGFTFTNTSLCCNFKNNEADDFIPNMRPIKSLPLISSITWDDLIA